MTKKEHFFRILILGFLTALGPFSIDMYLPGFPAIANDLHTTVNEVALSLSSFFVGLAAGQLLYGPMLDRFGRKNPLYIGLVLYIIASLGCMAAHSIQALILLRLVQAIGSCAAAVASVAMVRDLFPVEENAKVFSLLMLVVGASPMIAPTVGGYITAAYGWQLVFAILAAIAVLILLAVIFKLPETYKPDTSLSLKPGPILGNFLKVLKEPQFSTYAFTGAVAFSGLFAYVAGSPLVFMDIFHLDGKIYGWIFAGLSIGFIGCSQVNNLAMRFYKSEQIVRVALFIQVISGLLFVTAAVNGWLGLVGTVVFIFIFLCCLGFINSNAAALSLAPFSKNAGSASALMGCSQLAIGAFTSFAVGAFDSHTNIPLAAIMAASSVIALVILLIGRRQIKNQVEVSDEAGMAMH
ncbi:multidrug effflux MFS transporter [Mucilaginibacter paludis]|uniref:Drug resistance transporter, Bcr/CflA subfamily n=1 Tax=Mucilaginibacter paludis DSM 18603 TaxID=714943 RepID=H1YFK3_9SPHI|nr:multidrug effflux MFS transporter [Mucilaginibacter paludis]EHQ24405.1 drug resistance transporter, Bcr/CflA subfamily [Mucilaginibacter paludis DSM 18603]